MRAVFLAAAVAAAACGMGGCQAGAGGDARAAIDARPFPSFPAETAAGPIAAEARYYLDAKRTFGTDLVRDPRVLPIAVRLGVAPGATASVRFDPVQASPRLHLADGGVLSLAPLENVKTWSKAVNDRIVANALDARLLPSFSAAQDAYFYFDLGALGEVFVRDGSLSRKHGDAVSTMLIDRSLLAFDIEVDGRKSTVYVGVSTGNGAKAR